MVPERTLDETLTYWDAPAGPLPARVAAGLEHMQSLHWDACPGDDLEDDGRDCWFLLIDLADGRTLRITISGQDMHVDQRLKDPPRRGNRHRRKPLSIRFTDEERQWLTSSRVRPAKRFRPSSYGACASSAWVTGPVSGPGEP